MPRKKESQSNYKKPSAIKDKVAVQKLKDLALDLDLLDYSLFLHQMVDDYMCLEITTAKQRAQAIDLRNRLGEIMTMAYGYYTPPSRFTQTLN